MIANNVSTIGKQNADESSRDATPPRVPFLAAHSPKAGTGDNLDDVLDNISKTGSFLAAVVSTAPVIPALAAVAVALAYGMDPDWWPYTFTFGQSSLPSPIKHFPVFAGTLFVVVAWLIYVAFTYMSGRSAANKANVHEFNILFGRARQGAVQLAVQAKTRPGLTSANGSPKECDSARLAYEEAFTSCEDIAQKLCRPSMDWVLATGYVNMWSTLHDMEQAMIEIVPREKVVRDAEYDGERLRGSTIEDRDVWLAKLAPAIGYLREEARSGHPIEDHPPRSNGAVPTGTGTTPAGAGAVPTGTGTVPAGTANGSAGASAAPAEASNTLVSAVAAPKGSGHALVGAATMLAGAGHALAGAATMLAGTSTGNAPAVTAAVHAVAVAAQSQATKQTNRSAQDQERVSTEAMARADVRNVRRVIDEFRDDSRDKIVRACNHLKAAVFITGLAAYVLLDAAIGFDARGAMAPGATTQTRQAVHAAFQQGVRGVLVIFLVGVIIGFFGRLNVDTGASAAAEDYGLSSTRLRQIPVFSGLAAVGGVVIAGLVTGKGMSTELVSVLKPDIGVLITAAIFGLTPGLLVDRLQQQTTDLYKRDLKSTQPTAQVDKTKP